MDECGQAAVDEDEGHDAGMVIGGIGRTNDDVDDGVMSAC